MLKNTFKFFLFLILVSIGLLFSGTVFAAGTKLTTEGIQFPDGTIQTTTANGIPGPVGPGCVSVYDDNGQYLGTLITIEVRYARIYNPSTKKVYDLYSTKDGYCTLYGSAHLYETTDCTGPAYYWAEGPPVYFMTLKGLNGYFTLGSVKTITYKSYRLSSSGWVCESVDPQTTTAAELVPTDPPPFTWPVKLPLTFDVSP